MLLIFHLLSIIQSDKFYRHFPRNMSCIYQFLIFILTFSLFLSTSPFYSYPQTTAFPVFVCLIFFKLLKRKKRMYTYTYILVMKFPLKSYFNCLK